MSTTATTQSTAGTASSARRILALARAETLLLMRNPYALATALGAPLILVFAQVGNASSAGSDGVAQLDLGALVVASLAGFSLIFSVYYNLVVALVARREGLVLKRLRSGTISDAEILAATAAPAMAITLAQVLLGSLVAVTFLEMRMPANIALIAIALVLGAAVFVLLAAVSSCLAGSAEAAQLTAAPLLVVSMIASGLMFPLTGLPAPVHWVADVLPLTPVVDLLRLGFAGRTPDGASVSLAGSFVAAVVPVLILGAWVVVGRWATKRWFRWEPRR